MYTTSRTQHCVTLSTTEAEFVSDPWPKELKRNCLDRFDNYRIKLLTDNEKAKAMAENLLSLGRCRHINLREYFIRELVECLTFLLKK